MVTKNKWHDHKVVGVARNLQRSSVWIPLLRQGQLELVAQDHIQLSYVFKDGDSGQTISMFYMFPCDPPGQTISMFEHLHNRHFFPILFYSYGILVCASWLFCFWVLMRRVWLGCLHPSLCCVTNGKVAVMPKILFKWEIKLCSN